MVCMKYSKLFKNYTRLFERFDFSVFLFRQTAQCTTGSDVWRRHQEEEESCSTSQCHFGYGSLSGLNYQQIRLHLNCIHKMDTFIFLLLTLLGFQSILSLTFGQVCISQLKILLMYLFYFFCHLKIVDLSHNIT